MRRKYSKYRMLWFFFFQAEDGIRDLVRSRGLGDVYKRQALELAMIDVEHLETQSIGLLQNLTTEFPTTKYLFCLLYTSDAADERSSVDLGGRRIIKKKKYYEI